MIRFNTKSLIEARIKLCPNIPTSLNLFQRLENKLCCSHEWQLKPGRILSERRQHKVEISCQSKHNTSFVRPVPAQLPKGHFDLFCGQTINPIRWWETHHKFVQKGLAVSRRNSARERVSSHRRLPIRMGPRHLYTVSRKHNLNSSGRWSAHNSHEDVRQTSPSIVYQVCLISTLLSSLHGNKHTARNKVVSQLRVYATCFWGLVNRSVSTESWQVPSTAPRKLPMTNCDPLNVPSTRFKDTSHRDKQRRMTSNFKTYEDRFSENVGSNYCSWGSLLLLKWVCSIKSDSVATVSNFTLVKKLPWWDYAVSGEGDSISGSISGIHGSSSGITPRKTLPLNFWYSWALVRHYSKENTSSMPCPYLRSFNIQCKYLE